jgi:molecular chaperone DnaJ
MSDRGDRTDYYAVLGVPHDASQSEIESAYRDRVKETHPDLNDDPDASERFQRVKRAEEVLADPDERARYDRLGHADYVGNGAPSGGGSPGGSTGGNTASGGASSGSGSRTRSRARWTADGWTAPGGATGGSGTGTATTGGSEASGTEVDPGDIGDRLTAVARFIDRYRFRVDPKTAMFGMATFFLYPVFLASTVAPRFPLAVNLFLLCCLLCTVGYLLATPEVGIPVFGAWSAFGPIIFIFVDRPLLSWAGFFLVATTLVPFGLSLMIMEVLRVD